MKSQEGFNPLEIVSLILSRCSTTPILSLAHLHPAELGGDVEFALLGHQQHVPVAVVHRPVRHAEHITYNDYCHAEHITHDHIVMLNMQ